MQRERIAYIEPRSDTDRRPCQTIPALLNELWHQAGLENAGSMPVGLSSRQGANRKKVRITVTVEEVK